MSTRSLAPNHSIVGPVPRVSGLHPSPRLKPDRSTQMSKRPDSPSVLPQDPVSVSRTNGSHVFLCSWHGPTSSVRSLRPCFTLLTLGHFGQVVLRFDHPCLLRSSFPSHVCFLSTPFYVLRPWSRPPTRCLHLLKRTSTSQSARELSDLYPSLCVVGSGSSVET